MKKFLTLGVVAALALGSAGCGELSQMRSKADAAETQSVSVEVGREIARLDLALIGAARVATLAAQPGIPDAIALKGTKAAQVRVYLDKANSALRLAHTAYTMGNVFLAQGKAKEADDSLQAADTAGLAAARQTLAPS
jgi:hypothetical protein